MAHFAVVTPAFYSHFNAMSALAVELIDRGHRVSFLHRPDAAQWVADERIGFHAVGLDTHPPGSVQAALRRAANPGGPLGLRRVIEDMADSTAMLCRELPAALDTLGIDAILADQMEAAGGLVAEALRIPFVSVACALPVNREPGVPLPVMPFEYGQSERHLKMAEGSTRVYDWMMSPHRRAIALQARLLGLGERDNLQHCLSPLAQISQTTSAFDFPRRALPAHFHHVGPLRFTKRAASARDRDYFLPEIASDRPFVFTSLGSMQGARFGLFRRIVRACRALDVQLLVAHCGGLDAHQEQVLRGEGATWVCAFARQEAVLARADAVVSHAGVNTVMDAIAARTPMLALPIAFDHPGAAARVVHAGIGLRMSPRFARASAIRRQVRRLLDEPGFRQRLEPLAANLAQAGGTPRAADIVEAALHLRRTPDSVACLG
ncbi:MULTISPECIES: glycosyltransferase [unclassified Massilia]|uniref:glycosyltransferase n=1 Tax=unclassified Massilia TaxID=2609279 RepID=UPI001B81181C|nr:MULTISPECIES: nucleotide disphospho-sugar-binding domain-containing protein [unclassified Massilia]MBQ5941506.1 glycosyltransferase [Massilia sp. AB1]MBQ5963941.1 glycosyltransferase [Massilia sp. ZL223]